MRILLEKMIRYLAIGSFVMPLFFGPFLWNDFIFPFIVPKILLFRSLTLLMVGCFVLLLMINFQKYKVKNTPLTIAVLLFVTSFALSTFIGVDWVKSFWDNQERMLGLFTLLHYVLFYLVLTTVVKTKEEWRHLLWWALCLGSGVLVLALFQKISPNFLLNQGNPRVSSTLGNAIYLAGYGLFLGAAGLLLFVNEERPVIRYTALALSLLGFSGIFLSSTRGTLLGTSVAVLVVLLLYFFQGSLQAKQKKTLLGILFAGFALFATLFYFRQTTFIKELPAVGRLLNSYTEITQRSPRLMAWGIAIESWKEKPFFGWGPNNFYYAFNKYYRPEYVNFGWGETWFDNAHNVVVNTLAVQGIVGLLTYVGMFVAAIIMVVKYFQKEKLEKNTVFIIIGFLVAHFIHNIFVFENPTSYLYFFFFLAYINSMSQTPVAEEKKVRSNAISLLRFTVVSCLMLGLMYRTNIEVGKANMRSFEAVQAIYMGKDIQAAYNLAVETPTPHIDDVRVDISRAIMANVPAYAEAKRLEEIKPLFFASYEDMKKNRVLHPLDIRIHLQEAQLAQLGAQAFQRPELLQEAEVVLDDALVQSPKRQQIQYMLASFSFQLGKSQKAEQLLLDAIHNNPQVDESWWRLALLYVYGGKNTEAKNLMAQAEAEGIKIDPSRLESINKLIESSTPTSTRSVSKRS